ncbi:pyridoxal phosphate-dependent transferase [Haematococcus lacustris]
MASGGQPLQAGDYAQMLSQEGRRIRGAALSGLVAQFAALPDVIALHAGLPPPASFPLEALELVTVSSPQPDSRGVGAHAAPATVPAATGIAAEAMPGSDAAETGCTTVRAGEATPDAHVAPGSRGAKICISAPSEVVAAQQYCFSAGYPPLLDWVQRTMRELHAPPAPAGCASVITAGAVHAVSLLTSLLLDPGDWLVIDQYSYSHAIETIFLPKGLRLLPVRMDEQGMEPEHLEQQLQWAQGQLQRQAQQPSPQCASQPGCGGPGAGAPPDSLPPPRRPPSVVYLIPTGHNPTAITMPLARRQALYQVCRAHRLLIIEDDAYAWLHWGPPPPHPHPPTQPTTLPLPPQQQQHPVSHEQLLPQAGREGELGGASAAPPPPSFLSLDQDGRVLRVDTLSKVLGPGFRLGWVSGPPPLVDKLAVAAQGSCVGPSSLAQVVVWKLLESWGQQGWRQHLAQLHALYAHKAAAMAAAAEEHLGGLATWGGGAACCRHVHVAEAAGRPW